MKHSGSPIGWHSTKNGANGGSVSRFDNGYRPMDLSLLACQISAGAPPFPRTAPILNNSTNHANINVLEIPQMRITEELNDIKDR